LHFFLASFGLEYLTKIFVSGLRFFLAVVVTKAIMQGIADRAGNQIRDGMQLTPARHGRRWISVNRPILGSERFVAF